jgi:hypothetical protein
VRVLSAVVPDLIFMCTPDGAGDQQKTFASLKQLFAAGQKLCLLSGRRRSALAPPFVEGIGKLQRAIIFY